MKARLVLYVSGILMYAIFRSFQPAPIFDKIEIISDDTFILNEVEYKTSQIEEVIRDYRRTINPDKKADHIIEFEVDNVTMGIVQDIKSALRKNGLLRLFYRARPWWQFWK